MKVTIVGRVTGHQNQHCAALEQGLRVLGIDSQRRTTSAGSNSPVIACWGWRAGQHMRTAGADVLVMERGYLGDRFAWTSLAWNGLNGKGTFPLIDDGGARFTQHHGHLMKPWRENGSGQYVLLIGQVHGDAALAGRDLYPWYCQQARQWRERTGLPVHFRPHPLAHKRAPVRSVPFTKTVNGDLRQALDCAAVVVTFSSNTAVESILHGVSTVAMDPGSMAWDVAAHSASQWPVYSDRDRWAAQLACKQWRLDEIISGAALRPLFEMREAGLLRAKAVAHG